MVRQKGGLPWLVDEIKYMTMLYLAFSFFRLDGLCFHVMCFISCLILTCHCVPVGQQWHAATISPWSLAIDRAVE